MPLFTRLLCTDEQVGASWPHVVETQANSPPAAIKRGATHVENSPNPDKRQRLNMDPLRREKFKDSFYDKPAEVVAENMRQQAKDALRLQQANAPEGGGELAGHGTAAQARQGPEDDSHAETVARPTQPEPLQADPKVALEQVNKMLQEHSEYAPQEGAFAEIGLLLLKIKREGGRVAQCVLDTVSNRWTDIKETAIPISNAAAREFVRQAVKKISKERTTNSRDVFLGLESGDRNIPTSYLRFLVAEKKEEGPLTPDVVKEAIGKVRTAFPGCMILLRVSVAEILLRSLLTVKKQEGPLTPDVVNEAIDAVNEIHENCKIPRRKDTDKDTETSTERKIRYLGGNQPVYSFYSDKVKNEYAQVLHGNEAAAVIDYRNIGTSERNSLAFALAMYKAAYGCLDRKAYTKETLQHFKQWTDLVQAMVNGGIKSTQTENQMKNELKLQWQGCFGAKPEWALELSSEPLKKACLEVLTSLQTHKHAWAFNQPVDPVKDNLPDYFHFVKKPMDLGTIRQKLEDDSFDNKNLQDFEDDVLLTFDNATLYNGDKNIFHIMAKEMKKTFNKDFDNLMRKLKKEQDSEG